jgi:hypothetical protein
MMLVCYQLILGNVYSVLDGLCLVSCSLVQLGCVLFVSAIGSTTVTSQDRRNAD